MTTPMIAWAAVAAFFLILIAVRIGIVVRHHLHGRKFFSMGTAHEQFFIPGDAILNDDNVYDTPEDL